jgi:hypothetical protein
MVHDFESLDQKIKVAIATSKARPQKDGMLHARPFEAVLLQVLVFIRGH